MGTLSVGAKNAVEVCMGVKLGEHVLIITDKDTYAVGEALKLAAEKVTRSVEMHVLEDYGTRPLTSLPKKIEGAIPNANVTFWAAQSMKGELQSLRSLHRSRSEIRKARALAKCSSSLHGRRNVLRLH